MKRIILLPVVVGVYVAMLACGGSAAPSYRQATRTPYKSSFEVTYEVWDHAGMSEDWPWPVEVRAYYVNPTGGSVSDSCRKAWESGGKVYDGMPCRYTFTMARGQWAYVSASTSDGFWTVCRILVDGRVWRYSEAKDGDYLTATCSGYVGEP